MKSGTDGAKAPTAGAPDEPGAVGFYPYCLPENEFSLGFWDGKQWWMLTTLVPMPPPEIIGSRVKGPREAKEPSR